MKKPQITLLVALLLSLNTLAVQAGKLKEVADLKDELVKLKAEMLRLISTDDEEAFTRVCEQLKTESRQQGEERIFYSAWGYQSTYEATHQNYVKAEQIADRIAEYAAAENSHWGNYVVLHTKAVNALQKQDYSLADSLFNKAVAFRHKYFPGESAGDDLQELMKIANHLKDENVQLKRQRIYIIIIAVVIILVLLIGQHRLRIRRLEKENVRLNKAHQEAKQAFDMKNEFITHITNELRKPLHPIEGFSDILGTTDYDLKPEERELLSTHIKDNSRRITRLIDELAELSYFESKSSLPVNYTISPNHLLRHMVDYMRPRCKEGVRMFLESDLSDDYTTATSQEAFETLMRHLLDNAIQFTDHGVITVACTEYGDMVRVSVTDTGCGIAPELRDHVFDTFQEMADNMKLKGLGLPICKAIVQLLGGRIWLDTDYHEGTRFIFDLPHMK